MTYRVAISDCRAQFQLAHEALIESLGGAGCVVAQALQSGGQSHWQLMEHNWKLKYGITPRNGSGSTAWKYLDFASEKHYTAFLLRWS